MARITIKSDGNGGAIIIGTPPGDNGFFDFALGKVLSGKFTEISWEPLPIWWEKGKMENE